MLSSILPIIQDLTGGESLIHDQPFMACVLGAFFCGGGIGVAFSANGSTGGTDIIAAIVNKYRDITLGRVILMCDLVIISSSYLYCMIGRRWYMDMLSCLYPALSWIR